MIFFKKYKFIKLEEEKPKKNPKFKKCKHCREEFLPQFFNQKNCFKEECRSIEVAAIVEKQKAKADKEWRKRKQKMEIEVKPKKYKNELQKQINLLARKIDEACGYTTCIDCSKPFGKQKDAGHFNSVGSNATLRYNLHNIHTQKSDCNRNGLGGGRRFEYFKGLVERYGEYYANHVDTGLQIQYKEIHLTNQEIYEKYILVRKLNRDFDTFEIKDGIQARKLFNKLIGIYHDEK